MFRFLSVAICLLPLAAAAQPLAFVVDSDSAAISVIDMRTRAELRRIPVLRQPHHITLAPDGRFVLVGDTLANQLLFLDPATGAIEKRLPIADPYQLIFSPDGQVLTITGLARNQIDLYDAATLRLLHRVPARSMPSHIAYSPNSRTVYVTLQGSDRLDAIDIATGAVTWSVKVGHTPAGVLWNRGALLVGLMGENGVAEVDPATGAVRGRIVTGRGAHNLFFSPDARDIYVTNRVDGTITVLDAASLRPRRQYRVPGGPDDLAFAPDGTIWITQRFNHGVLVLDPASGATTRIDVGRSPHGIWLNTDPHLRLARQ